MRLDFAGGPKLLYLNMNIRGYPKGIRAGLDPRKPSLDINEAFTVMTYKGIPYQLQSVEVWGCGTPQSRYTVAALHILPSSHTIQCLNNFHSLYLHYGFIKNF